MKDLLNIYKIMIRHYGYLIAGLVFMTGYALFSGASITMAIPFFDYVFPQTNLEILHFNWPDFYIAIRQVILDNSHLFNFSSFFNFNNLRPVFEQLGTVMEQTDSMLMLQIVSVLVLTTIMIKNIFYYLNRLMFANLNGKTIQDIRDLLFTNYMEQSMRFFSRYRIGDTLVRLVNDVEIISILFVTSMFNVIRDVLLVLVFMRIALFLNARLFLLSLVVLPVTTFIVTALGKKIKKYSQRIQSKFSDIFSKVEEVLTNIKIVKAYGREEEQIGIVKQLNRKFFLFWRKAEIYRSFGVPISEINGTIIGVIILLLGGKDVLSGSSSFSFGEFGAFLLALFSVMSPIKDITRTYNDLRKAMVSLSRISEVLNQKPDLLEDEDSVEKKSFDDKVVFDRVYFTYDKVDDQDSITELNRRKIVLSDVSFTINKGEKVALVGSSGSGKTTVSNLLLRLYDATEGEVLIDGLPIKKIRGPDLRNLFGIVTQESLLFTETIADNIRFGSSKPVTMQEIQEACRIAYADEFIEQLPDKYDSFLYAKGSNLSGGQKQRLCIARAIVANPPILILDEATSSLDTETEKKVQMAIERATEQRTVLIIAHRLSTILSSDRIIVLDEGKIVGTGTHNELLESCDRYRTLYKMQFQN